MAIITFFMRADYPAKAEDILLSVNDQRGTTLKDVSEWERMVIREYLSGMVVGPNQQQQGFIGVYRKWETEKRLNDGTGKEIDAEFTFSEDGYLNDQPPSEGRPYMRKLQIGDKQLAWLRKSIGFYRAYEAFILKRNPALRTGQLSETRVKSVGELIAELVDGAAWQALAKSDVKELDEEEQAIKKSEEPPKPDAAKKAEESPSPPAAVKET